MTELKTYLRLNSLFSMLSGIAMTYYSNELAHFLNITNNDYLLESIGFNLIIFSCFVWFVSTKKLTHKTMIKLIVFLDIAWVVGSILIVVFQLFNLSTNGYLLIAIVAIWIGFLAYKQWNGLQVLFEDE